MSKDTQYGCALFVDDFKAGVVKPMKRITFLKNGPQHTDYDEVWLQRLIMSHPRILPVDQIEPAFSGLVPVCIELPTTPVSFMDNLLVTPSGNLALIECKLWRNPQARREVIGQIIDYAKDLSSWSYEKLDDAIRRTRTLDGRGERSRGLYATVSADGEIDEVSFIDAVSRNLRRGRFLLLIVGDGIREGVESMTEFLQQYAGLHFTLAVVELALFEVPTGGYIAQPRVLAKTVNIDRGIVTVDGSGQIAIRPTNPAEQKSGDTGTKTTITKELYFEKLERAFPGMTGRLSEFITKLDMYGVTVDFGIDSMILRWYDDTKRWNLGTILSSGKVSLDYTSFQADGAGIVDVSQQYLRHLAGLVPHASVAETPKTSGWYVKDLWIKPLLETRQDEWLRAITEFQAGVRKSSDTE